VDIPYCWLISLNCCVTSESTSAMQLNTHVLRAQLASCLYKNCTSYALASQLQYSSLSSHWSLNLQLTSKNFPSPIPGQFEDFEGKGLAWTFFNLRVNACQVPTIEHMCGLPNLMLTAWTIFTRQRYASVVYTVIACVCLSCLVLYQNG